MKDIIRSKQFLITLVLLLFATSLLSAQSRKDLIRKYGSKLKSSGVIKKDLTSAQVDAISKNPGSASSIVEYTGKPLDKTQVRELERDLRSSGQLDRKLTAAEVQIISENPDKAGKIAEITEYAQIKAKEAAARNPDISEDSYRHVLWSYMLTKEFGEEFSEKVTSAHEIGSTNTAEESQKDLRNNEIGRQLAAQGASETDILRQLAPGTSGGVSSPGAEKAPRVRTGSFSAPTASTSEPIPAVKKKEKKDPLQVLAIEKGIIKPDYDTAKIIAESTNENNVLMWIVMTKQQRENLINEVKGVYKEHGITIGRSSRFYVRVLDSYVLNGIKEGKITPSKGLGQLNIIFRNKAINGGDFINHHAR